MYQDAPWYFHYELGRDLYRRGDPQRALDALIEAATLRADPGHGARIYGMWFMDYLPYLEIARAHARLGNWDCAQNALEYSRQAKEVSERDKEFGTDIYSSVLTGHKLIVVLCDNAGFAVINRLQNFKGVPSFNNLLRDCRIKSLVRVDFAKHAEAMGAIAEHVRSIADLESALQRAKGAERTTVIVVDTDPASWTPGDAWWDVGVPAESNRESVRQATADHAAGKRKQRIGV